MRDEMLSGATDAIGVKVGAALSGFGAVLAWDAPVAVIGVPVSVLLAALTGALLGVIYGTPLGSRKAVAQAITVNTFLAGGFAVVAPHVPLFGWLKQAPLGAIALILAFSARWAVPAAVEHLPALVSRYMGKFSTKGGTP